MGRRDDSRHPFAEDGRSDLFATETLFRKKTLFALDFVPRRTAVNFHFGRYKTRRFRTRGTHKRRLRVQLMKALQLLVRAACELWVW